MKRAQWGGKAQVAEQKTGGPGVLRENDIRFTQYLNRPRRDVAEMTDGGRHEDECTSGKHI
jgi:hypothetical protein